MKALYILFFFILSFAADSSEIISQRRIEILSGKRPSEAMAQKRFGSRSKKNLGISWFPSRFLATNFHYLPSSSRVLDISIGEGQNAIFLSRKGHEVVGLASDEKKLKKAKLLAKEFGIKIKVLPGSIDKIQISEGSFDVIIGFDNKLIKHRKKILSWLRPGGIFLGKSFTTRQLEIDSSLKDENLIKPRELLNSFRDMMIVKYEEPLHLDSFYSAIIFKKSL